MDHCAAVIGDWQPDNKFMCMYSKLDELCDKVADLDPAKLDGM